MNTYQGQIDLLKEYWIEKSRKYWRDNMNIKTFQQLFNLTPNFFELTLEDSIELRRQQFGNLELCNLCINKCKQAGCEGLISFACFNFISKEG